MPHDTTTDDTSITATSGGMDGAMARVTLSFTRPTVSGVSALALTVHGEVDASTADTLYRAVQAGLAELDRQEREDPVVQTRALLIDLREVAFLGIRGLDRLLAAARNTSATRGPLRLVVDHNNAVIRPTPPPVVG